MAPQASALRIRAALEHAAEDARSLTLPEPDHRPRTIEVVMGDPQAPFDKALAILDRRGLLADDGRLRAEVRLFSIGDHFDYGDSSPWATADVERSGRLLLAWLAAHPPDQVTLIAGNHDLARVGELAAFDDTRFTRAQVAAQGVHHDSELEARFQGEFPELPCSEVARRDFNGFSVAQRELVTRLLRSGRFLVAHAHGSRTLLCHAGVSSDDSGGSSDVKAIAGMLNERLQRAALAWNGSDPLIVPGLHQPGNARDGEGGGIFYHRPCHPERARRASFSGPFRRRYDPRRLPAGVVQVIGHIRDNKCRELFGDWAVGPEAREGELRHLLTDGREVRYAAGLPRAAPRACAQMVFVDGGMNYAPIEDYELLDLQSVR